MGTGGQRMNASPSKQRRPSRAYRDGVCSRCGLPLKLPPGRDLCGVCAERALLLWATAAIEAAQHNAPVARSQGAQPALRYTADTRWRIAYTLPDGRDVLVSPAPGAVPIVRWLAAAG